LKRGETNGVDGTEDENESETSGSGALVGSLRQASWNRLGVKSSGNSHGEPGDAAANVREQEKWSTTNSVYKSSTQKSPAELLAVVDENDVGLP